MCSAIERMIVRKAREDAGQSTVEAAFALPILMVLILLMLQPAIVLYDYVVLKSAAAEGCRLLATSAGGDENDDYMRRRLSAIPQHDLFHVHTGECSYQIEMDGDESSQEVSVTLSTKLKPLPLLDIGMKLSGLTDEDGCLKVEASSTMPTQADWVWTSASGASPAEWVRSL